jgi:hypothetical protein
MRGTKQLNRMSLLVAAFFLVGLGLAWPLVAVEAVPEKVAGASHCVRSGATGTGDGSDWTNAYPALPAKLVRGDTYYVADGQYPRHRFEDAEDGDKYITVKKAIEADHGPTAGWKKEYGDGVARFRTIQFMKGHYRFDGQVGGGPGSWTTGHGFEVFHPKGGTMIQILESGPPHKPQRANYIEIRHVNAQCPSIDVKGCAVYGCTGRYTNITISHCYFHDMFGAPLAIINWHDFLFEYNCVARNKCTPAWHSEAVSSRGCTRITYRYNWWENIQGTGIIMHMSGDATDWAVYGNVFLDTGKPPLGSTAHGVVADNQNGSAKRIKIYNNTIVGIRGICSGFRFFKGAGEIEVANNLWYDCKARAHMSRLTHDHNTYIRTKPPGKKTRAHDKVLEDHPFKNPGKSDFHLTRPTAPGKKLPAPYDKDMFGNPRGADGVWDRGAFEFMRK